MRKTISPKLIYHLACTFEKSHKNKQGRGRPRQYSFPLVLTIASIQNLYDLSFREALEFSEDIFPYIPSLSTFHYRVSTLKPETMKEFIAFLGMELQKQFHASGKKLKLFIVDGTGFSFNDVYPIQYLRGTEVRKIQSHVRALALVASTGKERFVIGAESGKAYTSEVKMTETLIPKFTFKKLPFLGYKAFDSINLLHLIKKQGALPAIKIKDTWRYGVRDLDRKKSQENERWYGRKRTLIEGLFGNTKQKTTSHIRVFKETIAETYALLRLALYDVYLLSSFLLKGGVWVIFRTASLNSLTRNRYGCSIKFRFHLRRAKCPKEKVNLI